MSCLAQLLLGNIDVSGDREGPDCNSFCIRHISLPRRAGTVTPRPLSTPGVTVASSLVGDLGHTSCLTLDFRGTTPAIWEMRWGHS